MHCTHTHMINCTNKCTIQKRTTERTNERANVKEHAKLLNAIEIISWQLCYMFGSSHSAHASHSNNDDEDLKMLCNHVKGY